jgi:hypothetical protein
MLSRRHLLGYSQVGIFTGHYKSSEIGFDPNLENAKYVTQVSGYFQTYKYFDAIDNLNLTRLNLLKPSNWYTQKLDHLDKFEWLGIHVRRGDFKNHASTVGLLSPSYYFNAVESLDAKVGKRLPVVVFSDEIEDAREMLEPLSARVHEWISPPRESSASESLLLMSRATAIVIANSTFSWWGAKLGRPKLVAAPKKWFKSGIDPSGIYPTDWVLVDSEWLVEFSV